MKRLYFLDLPVLLDAAYSPIVLVKASCDDERGGRSAWWIAGVDTYADLAKSAGKGAMVVEWRDEQKGETTC